MLANSLQIYDEVHLDACWITCLILAILEEYRIFTTLGNMLTQYRNNQPSLFHSSLDCKTSSLSELNNILAAGENSTILQKVLARQLGCLGHFLMSPLTNRCLNKVFIHARARNKLVCGTESKLSIGWCN